MHAYEKLSVMKRDQGGGFLIANQSCVHNCTEPRVTDDNAACVLCQVLQPINIEINSNDQCLFMK